MRIRTLALALALGCGMTTMAEAKQKPVHKVSVKKNKGYKTNKANRVKPRKVKPVKRRPLPKR